jgi:hypothetical protein
VVKRLRADTVVAGASASIGNVLGIKVAIGSSYIGLVVRENVRVEPRVSPEYMEPKNQ